jgi:hypothetical protein
MRRPHPSVLYPPGYPHQEPDASQPDTFIDLNLDQVVTATLAGRSEYQLAEYFHTPLHTPDAVAYRHDICRRLENAQVRGCIDEFAAGLRRMRDQLRHAATMYDLRQRQRWLLDAAATYRSCVQRIAQQLPTTPIGSGGLRLIADYLTSYTHSDMFAGLGDDIDKLATTLAAVRYCVHLHGNKVTVTRYNNQPDYSADIVDTFDRFRTGQVAPEPPADDTADQMNHVETGILDGVAKLWPDIFTALDTFAQQHNTFADATVARFDREVQFYLAWLDHIGTLSLAGLAFCYPHLDLGRDIDIADTYDVALAARLTADSKPVVRNNITLTAPHRIAVVTGANQGGKTTFARTVGQLHYLAGLGLPVAGSHARLPLADQVFTHFEKQERPGNLRSKLEDDLLRIRNILSAATGRSVVILNEAFTSTTADDAEHLGRRILHQLIDLDAVGIYVTFIDELASIHPAVLSLAATVDSHDPLRRTYTIVNQPADGRAYADTLADHYGLTYPRLHHRLTS